MFCNASATLYAGNNTYTFNKIYRQKKTNSEIDTRGQTNKIQHIVYVPQSETGTDLKTINIEIGHDYFMFPNDERKHTITSFVDAMYGSKSMQHLEFVLT